MFIRRSQRYRNARAYCSDPHMSRCLPLIVGRQYPRMTCLYLVHTRLYRHCKNYRVRWCIFPVVRDKWRKWTADLEKKKNIAYYNVNGEFNERRRRLHYIQKVDMSLKTLQCLAIFLKMTDWYALIHSLRICELYSRYFSYYYNKDHENN